MIKIEVTLGDALDRYSILVIKSERADDELTKEVIKKKEENLGASIQLPIIIVDKVLELYKKLKETNEKLWDLENEIRKPIKPSEITKVVKIALEIAGINDARSMIKKEIDILAGDSPEVKIYEN